MITSDQLQESVLKNLPEQDQEAVMRVVLSGKQVLFNQNMHELAFDSIAKDEGSGVAQIMYLMDKKAGGSIPRGAIFPSAAILLVKVLEFEGSVGMKNTDDAMLASIMKSMSGNLMEMFGAQQTQSTQQPQPTQQAPQGLINAGAQP